MSAAACLLAIFSRAAFAQPHDTERLPTAHNPKGQSPEQSFAENAYEIVHMGDSAESQIGEKGSSWRAVRGLVYRLDTDPAVFFDSAGRPDLAARVRSRRRVVQTVNVSSYLVGFAGIGLTIWGIGIERPLIWGSGIGGMLGGVVMHEIAEGMRDSPAVPEVDALDAAANYNRQLRARLGLTSESLLPEKELSRGASWTLVPNPLPGGMGLSVASLF